MVVTFAREESEYNSNGKVEKVKSYRVTYSVNGADVEMKNMRIHELQDFINRLKDYAAKEIPELKF